MEIGWKNDFTIKVRRGEDTDTVIIEANKEGLRSLADQLSALAEEAPGTHIHYDEYNSLEAGSSDLIIEKTR